MSFIKRNALKAREMTSRAAVSARNAIRRMAVLASVDGAWQLLGPNEERSADVEVFHNIGFASRPESGSETAEVILVHVHGASGHPVVVASRDEATRVDLDEDETAIFTAGAIVKIKADDTIEIGTRGGTFSALVTQADFVNHTHLTAGTGAPVAPTPIASPPGFVYTTKLRAE